MPITVSPQQIGAILGGNGQWMDTGILGPENARLQKHDTSPSSSLIQGLLGMVGMGDRTHPANRMGALLGTLLPMGSVLQFPGAQAASKYRQIPEGGGNLLQFATKRERFMNSLSEPARKIMSGEYAQSLKGPKNTNWSSMQELLAGLPPEPPK